MKTIKRILLVGISLVNLQLYAQNDTIILLKIQELENITNRLEQKNKSLEANINKINVRLSKFIDENQKLIKKQDSIIDLTHENREVINRATQDLNYKISTTQKSTNEQVLNVANSIDNTNLYILIGLGVSLVFLGAVYLALRNRQKELKLDIVEDLKQQTLAIEEKIIGEFVKQTTILEKDLDLIINNQKQYQNNSLNNESAFNTIQDIDHSLALKLASEINIIERNLSLMSPDVKGLKQLQRSVTKLKDNLMANGYEIPTLLNQPFKEGSKVIIINNIIDESFETGKKVISKVIIPQVNYNNEMIQAAQIEITTSL